MHKYLHLFITPKQVWPSVCAREALHPLPAPAGESPQAVQEAVFQGQNRHRGNILIGAVFKLRNLKGIKILCILRDIGKLNGSAPEKQKGVKLHIIRKVGLPLGVLTGMYNRDCLVDPAGQGKAVAEVPDQVHLVRQVTEFLVNVKTLGKQIHRVVVMPLELEIVTGMVLEVLKIPGVPDHTDLIHKYDRFRGNGINAKLGRVKEINTRHRNGGIADPAFPVITHGQFCDHGGLTGTLLAEHHDKLVGIAETPPVVCEENKNGKQDKGQYVPEKHAKTSGIYQTQNQRHRLQTEAGGGTPV